MTLKEIAAKTGYSIATVSRVLSKSGNYSDTSKAYDVITNFAAENGYKRKLKQNSLVAIVVPDIENPLFGAVVKAVQRAGAEDGLQVIVVNTNEDPAQEAHALQFIATLDLLGMIYTPVHDMASQEFMSIKLQHPNGNVPVVLVDRDLQYASCDSVFINNIAGAFDATCYLLGKGIRRIAIIAGLLDTKPGRERLIGYQKAYEHYKLTPDERLVYKGDFTMESGYQHTKAILKAEPRPQAIFSSNNLMTRGCLKALIEARIPIGTAVEGGIALVSFDNDVVLDMLRADIPYVQRPMAEMGKIALDLLKARARQSGGAAAPIQRIELSPILIYK